MRRWTQPFIAATLGLALLIGAGATVRYYRNVAWLQSIAARQQPFTVAADRFPGTPAQRIGIIGDSLSNDTAERAFADDLATSLHRPVLLVNRALPGTSTVHWLPTGRFYVNAKAAFTANKVRWVCILLGTNDALRPLSVSPEHYRADLQTIVDDLHASGFRVLIHSPPYCAKVAGTRRGELLIEYRRAIHDICDGGNAFEGDKVAYDYFAQHRERLRDGIHPDPDGYRTIASLWARAAAGPIEKD
jgi:lysophospholipase L1-like esterase